MKTKAVRIYGKGDLRLETFELPPIKTDEILAKVVSDSLCMSSYKAVKQGAEHKRVPDDVAANPTILGHEFCGEIIEVGEKWRDRFAPGTVLHPADVQLQGFSRARLFVSLLRRGRRRVIVRRSDDLWTACLVRIRRILTARWPNR